MKFLFVPPSPAIKYSGEHITIEELFVNGLFVVLFFGLFYVITHLKFK